MASDALASVAVIAISASVAALPQFLPRLSEVHHAAENSSEAIDIRVGEVATVAFLLSIGAIASNIAGSIEPMKASMLMAVFVVTTYEVALRNNFGVTDA